MRLWPYQMFSVLPYRQMLAQWRECLAVSGMLAKDLENKSGINHYIIDRVKNYSIEHFVVYCDLVRKEFERRNWTIGTNTIEKLNNDINFENVLSKIEINEHDNNVITPSISIKYDNIEEILFYGFHDDRYIKQCLYKFQEMYDCDALTSDVWKELQSKFSRLIEY